MADDVRSDATITVWLDQLDSAPVTVQSVKDWVAEVERLSIPSDTKLDECVINVCFRSQILEPTYSESDLGVEGIDILVGMPR